LFNIKYCQKKFDVWPQCNGVPDEPEFGVA